MKIPYYFIGTVGTLRSSPFARQYPRHLVLAQLWQWSLPYRETIKQMRQSFKTRIILDNGAHEGYDINPKDYINVCEELRPDVVVLTDLVKRPSVASRERAFSIVERLYTICPDAMFMYPPQGQSQAEILAEYDWAQTTLDPAKYIIGVGQSYLTWETEQVRNEDARINMMLEVMRLPNAWKARYHILGGRWRPTMMFTTWAEVIVGLDSVKPVTCSLNNTVYPIRPQKAIDRMSMKCPDEDLLINNVGRFAVRYDLSID